MNQTKKPETGKGFTINIYPDPDASPNEYLIRISPNSDYGNYAEMITDIDEIKRVAGYLAWVVQAIEDGTFPCSGEPIKYL